MKGRIRKEELTSIFASLQHQRKFMDDLFVKFKLKKLDDWKKVKYTKMWKYGGKTLLTQHYSNDMRKLLSSIYPEHRWKFDGSTTTKAHFTKIPESQYHFIEDLYKKLDLKSFEDFYTVSIRNFEGGRNLSAMYDDKKSKLFKKLYPNYPWQFEEEFKEISFQKEFMDNLYRKLKLKSLNDWQKVTKKTIIDNGGKPLIDFYSDNMEKLFQTIYPDLTWLYEKKEILKQTFKTLKHQQSFIHSLYYKFNFKTIDDWLEVSHQIIMENGVKNLLICYYGNDWLKLLSVVYPDHQWNYTRITPNSLAAKSNLLRVFSMHKIIMNQLYNFFQLNSLDDWIYFSESKVLSFEVGRILLEIYSFNFHQLLKTVYPDHIWNFPEKDPNLNFIYNNNNDNNDNDNNDNNEEKIIINLVDQKKQMDKLYKRFKLNTLNDWVNVKKKKFREKGGNDLLLLYGNNFKKLLRTIYPDKEWIFTVNRPPPKIRLSFPNHQRIIAEELFYQNNFHTLDDWLNIKLTNRNFSRIRRIVKLYYAKKFGNFLRNIYPNYPWEINIKNDFEYRHIKMKSLKYRQSIMDDLYVKLKLTSLDGWLYVYRSKFRSSEEGFELIKYYSKNIESLLLSIYPNYPWEFDEVMVFYLTLKLIDHQRLFMDFITKKLELLSLRSWLSPINVQKLLDCGGRRILRLYRFNIRRLLFSVYPNYPWERKILSPIKFLHKFENRVQLMDYLFNTFKLNYIDDWLNVSIHKITQYGGGKLLFYHANNKKNLLSSVYPNFPWEFDTNAFKMEIKKKYKSLDFQKKLMEKLFIKLRLNTIPDWLNISKSKLRKVGGEYLLYYYDNDMKKLLNAIYPEYKSKWDKYKIRADFSMMKSQHRFMDHLFIKLKLKSLGDWEKISPRIICKYGGKSLYREYYGRSMKLLLKTIYPNYSWNLTDPPLRLKGEFKILENQYSYMEELYEKFQLKSIDGFLKIQPVTIAEYGGHSLINFYNNRIENLVSTLYPNYPWDFNQQTINHLHEMNRQRRFMNRLFVKLGLKSLDDWLEIRKSHVGKLGWKELVESYSNNFEKMLTTIYPEYNWKFENNPNYKVSFGYSRTREYMIKRILDAMKLYAIKKKSDWYRLDYSTDNIYVFRALQIICKDQAWKRHELFAKTKKSKQRLLFIAIEQIYFKFYIMENYHHPILERSLEYDIFVPALNIAVEYQGEQHYDDMPGGPFAGIELNQDRDTAKRSLSQFYNIHLLIIPYWWDLSNTSLIPTILGQLKIK